MKSNLQHSTERRQKNLWDLLTGKCIPCETLRLLSKFRACVYQFIKLLPTILSCLVGSILRLLMAFSSKAQNNLIVFSGFLSTIFPSRMLLFWFTFIPQGKEAGRPNEASLKAITKGSESIHSLAEISSESDQVILEVSKEQVGPEIQLEMSSFIHSLNVSSSPLCNTLGMHLARKRSDKQAITIQFWQVV